MGRFSGWTEGADALAPISRDRLIPLFDDQEWRYFVDNEGDLGGVWDDDQFYFLVRGTDSTFLHIQALWHTTPKIDYLEHVRGFIEEWHRRRLWPKCYHRITDEGRIRVFCENTIDYGDGATDEQLLQQVTCALGTAASFFEDLTTSLDL